MIRLTVETYMGEGKTAKNLSKRYQERVEREITRSGEQPNIKTLRNEFVHGALRSLASPITEEDFWESNVAGGMTPRMFLGESRYPGEYDRLRAGKYAMFATETTTLCTSLGSILGALEKDLPAMDSASM